MKLIVGLGNPGNEYINTRHNIGFMFLDYVFGEDRFVVNKKMNSLEYITSICGEKIIIIKPLTYMNLSGDAVIKYVNFYKIDISDIIVIQDDLDMPVGSFKLMYNHNAGGHNGIKDIILKMGSKDFLRIKIGISKPDNMDTKDYVLGKFEKCDKDKLNDAFLKLRDIFDDLVNMNFDSLMQKYNTKKHKE